MVNLADNVAEPTKKKPRRKAGALNRLLMILLLSLCTIGATPWVVLSAANLLINSFISLFFVIFV